MRGIRNIIKCALNAVLCLCLAAAFVGPARAEDRAVHSHAVSGIETSFTELTVPASAITASGSYYLSEDMELPSGLTVSGEGVTVDLCLNGHMLSCGSGTAVIQVTGGAVLNICDCYDAATHMGAEYEHTFRDPMDIRYDLTVTGGMIGASKMSGVRVSDGGELNLLDGTIAGCSSTGAGGGIYLQKGTVQIYEGAVIRKNLANSNGGGLYVQNGSASVQNRVELLGGQITDNAAKAAGGGVYLGGYTAMDMSGGMIAENDQTSSGTLASYGGGGVYLSVYSTLTQSGGQITKNAAASKCGGIFLNPLANVYLSGDVVVDQNHCAGENSNLCAVYKANTAPGSVVVAGQLTEQARIGLTYTKATVDDPVTLVTADSGYHGGAVPGPDYEKFYSDDPARSLLWNDVGEIALCVGRVHAVCGANCTHGSDGGSIHNQVMFRALPAGYTGGALAAGDYYLDGNVNLTTPMVITGTVNLCFNGHELKNSGGRVVEVKPTGSLTLCDCYTAATHSGAEYLHRYKNPQTKVDVTVTGGLLVGNHSLTTPSGGVEVTGGSFTFYTGTIGGASAFGGVRVMDGGQFELSGGTIADCLSSSSGGGVYADGTSRFTMTGGRILSNRARNMGGGVYTENGFSLSGDVRIIGNIVGAVENNVYLPAGTKIAVTGPVSGQVGVTMERRGVFTTGGAAPYVRSFRADASVGTFADVLGRELCLSGYGVSVQPTPETRTVIMRSPENVAAYQWYALSAKPLAASDVSGAECAYDPVSDLWTHPFTTDTDSINCFEIRLGEGDTLRVKSTSGLGSVSLMETVTTPEGTVLETSVASGAPDYEGFYDVTATKPGTYTLCVGAETLWHVGDRCDLTIARYERGTPAKDQAGATFTGSGGYHICKIEYDDGVTRLYSAPFQPGAHIHDTVTFTPIAATLSGNLLAGAALRGDFSLESGSYALHGDMTLSDSLRIPSGAAVKLCLNGCALKCETAGGIVVERGAVLEICDCQTGGSISGKSAKNGGGLCIEGSVILHAGTVTGGSASGHGGGIYVGNTGALTLSGDVQVTGNAPEDLYLASGRTVSIDAPLSERASVGIAMERPGVFTSGAGGAYLENFFPNDAGTFISQTNGELALRAYSIVAQPTVGRPTIVVGHPDDAMYQWYTASCERVGAFEESHTLSLEQGQILRVLPDSPLPDGTAISLSGVPLVPADDGAYLLTIAETGDYTLQMDAGISASVECYTIGTPVEGQTGDTLTAGPGAYVCRVTWPNGVELQSQLLVIPAQTEEPKPTPPSVIIIESSEKEKPSPAAPNPFSDVAESAWYYDDVRKAYENGWMLGTDECRFSPDQSMSRGMLVTVLWRMAGEPSSAGEMPFVDVPADAYYSMAIRWAYENGIVYGMDSTHFYPDREANREQAAAFFHRSAAALSASLLSGGDIPSTWAQEDINWAVSTGLLVGDTDGDIDPMGILTRAQFAALLTRFVSLIAV